MDINPQPMIGSFAVSNEMLYELLKEFKNDVNRRFDEIDKRFTIMEKANEDRFEYVKELIKSEKAEREKMQIQLDEIYKERKSMTVRFTTRWAFASFFIAMFASVSALGIDRAL